MNRGLRALAIALPFVVAYAAPANATVVNIWGPPGEICLLSAPCTGSFHYPIRQGRSPVLDIEGQYVDLSTGLEGDADVHPSKQSTSSSHILIKISVEANAAPGLHTIKLHYAVELNGPDTFKVLVLRAGKVTSVTPPGPNDYFNDVTVPFHGDKLENAGVIMLPDKVATFSVGGSQFPQAVILTHSAGSGSVTSSADAQANVKLHFDGGPFAEAKATVLLYDKQISADTCQLHRVFCYAGLDSTLNNETTTTIVGPNAVSAITFPTGSSVRTGSTLTVHVKLVKPSISGDTIHFQILPASSFAESPGSGVHFSTSGGQNTVSIPAHDQAKDITVQVVHEPAGCQQVCTATFETRMVNFTVDQPPFLRLATFSILAAKLLPAPLIAAPRLR